MTALRSAAQGLRTFASDIAEGFFEITHNSFALVGLAVVFAVVTLTARPDLRQAGEEQLVSWLQARKAAVLGMEPELEAVDRATATNPKDLPREQAAVAYWLSKKYRVAPEPLSALVVEAYEVGQRARSGRGFTMQRSPMRERSSAVSASLLAALTISSHSVASPTPWRVSIRSSRMPPWSLVRKP